MPLDCDELVASRLRVRVAVAVEHDLRAEIAHRLDLDLGRGLRHDDEGAKPQVAGSERDALRVIAGAGGDDAPCAFGRR